MLIQNYETCQHRLPGMPEIHCDPLCGLSAAGLCAQPTYETCPRYEWIEEHCPACREAMLEESQMVRDTIDWTLICPECGLELPANSLAVQRLLWPGLTTEDARKAEENLS